MSYRGRKTRPPNNAGDEQDAFTSWRQWLVGLSRPGKIKKIRRGFNKRARRAAKKQIREEE